MNSLILDCSLGMNVYVVVDDNVFCYENKSQNKHSDELLSVVDDLILKSGVDINDLDNICVCVGPGSFTGVRVAVSIAKGLVIGSHAKVYTLTNFDIFKTIEKNYCLVLDGFSNFVYARIVKDDNVKDECIEIEKLVELLKFEKLNIYCVTEKTQNLLKSFNINCFLAENDIVSAFKSKIINNSDVNLNQIYPMYLRASQAEIEREKKNK